MTHDTEWAGRLWLQPGFWAFSGEGGSAKSHRHHALQVAWGLDAELQAQIDGVDTRGSAIIVPSNTTHSFHSQGRVLLIFLEPSGQAIQLSGWPGADSARKLAERAPRSPADVVDWLDRVLEALAIPKPSRQLPSEPIRRAQALVLERLPALVRLPEAARVANLAPTTLTHRFASEVGLPFQRWVLWMRVQRAARVVAGSPPGASLTQAAHAAGFSDSAHFSRTFRGLFGLPPSRVLPRVRLVDLLQIDRNVQGE